MATYLITGVAGFIGSNLARALLADGATVRGIDDLSTGKRSNLDGLDGLTFVEADINDQGALTTAMEGAEYVLHQAAVPSVQRSVEAPLVTHHAIVNGTLAVLEAAKHSDTVRRVVYAASSSAYGETPTLPKHEDMRPTPLSPYAAAKLAGEQYCRVYTQVYGLETVALRYFNVFGPYQDPTSRYAAVIPKFVQCALRNEPPTINGDGEQTRDFTYIGNVIEANLKACTAPATKCAGEVFNIACGERVSLLQLLENVGKLLGKTIEPQHVEPRKGDVRHSLADITKARELLGYTASVSFAQGLERCIDWYRDNLQ